MILSVQGVSPVVEPSACECFVFIGPGCQSLQVPPGGVGPAQHDHPYAITGAKRQRFSRLEHSVFVAGFYGSHSREDSIK